MQSRLEEYRFAIRKFSCDEDAPVPRELLSDDKFIDSPDGFLDLKAIEARYPSLVEFSLSHKALRVYVYDRSSTFRWKATDRLWDHVQELSWTFNLSSSDVDRDVDAFEDTIRTIWPDHTGYFESSLIVNVEIAAHQIASQAGWEHLFRSLVWCPGILKLQLICSESQLESYGHLMRQLIDASAQREAKAMPGIVSCEMDWSMDDRFVSCESFEYGSISFANWTAMLATLGPILTHLTIRGRTRTRDFVRMLHAVHEQCSVLEEIETHCYWPQNSDSDRFQTLVQLGGSGRVRSLRVLTLHYPCSGRYGTWREYELGVIDVISSLARLGSPGCDAVLWAPATVCDISQAFRLMQR